MQAQHYQGSSSSLYLTPPQEHSSESLQTPTEESGGLAVTDAETALPRPTPVYESVQAEPDFSVADRAPEECWQKMMRKLPLYAEKWSTDGYDYYIQLRMEEKGPHCLGWGAFGAVLCDLYREATCLHAVRGRGVIRAAYTQMKERGCEKMCNVMKLVLLEL